MIFRKHALLIVATLAASSLGACSGQDSPNRSEILAPQRSVGGHGVTASPTSLTFASPDAASQTIVASTRFAGALTVAVDAGGSCSVSPSSQVVQPASGGIKTASFDVSPVSVGLCQIRITDKKGNVALVTANVLGPTCSYFMSLLGEGPTITSTGTSATITAVGGQFALAIVPSSDECTWTPTSNRSWILIDEPTGPQTGSNTVFYTVEPLPHTSAPRSGQIILAGVPIGSTGTLAVTINQIH